MNLKPLADYVNPLVAPYRAFVYQMPESETDAAVLLPDVSRGAEINQYLPGYRQANFLVVTRSSDFTTGYTRCKQVADLLKVTTNTQVGVFLVKQCVQLTEALPFRKSPGDFIEFSAEMRIYFIDLT